MSYRLTLSTLPDLETGEKIARELVGRNLAACVNLIPGIRSIFRWKGAVEAGDEVLAIIKTTAESYPALESALAELHPYEVPEIIWFPIGGGAAPYLDWIGREVAGRSGDAPEA
ncbi:MAG: divalent-cation tolerance protein CutA [Verrucomicrobiales bacterium]